MSRQRRQRAARFVSSFALAAGDKVNDVGVALTTWLSIAGLGLDVTGAALLAYDVLYAPQAHLLATNLRTRLAIATAIQERCERSLRRSPLAPDAERQDLQDELLEQRALCEETRVELGYWESQERRAELTAVFGLSLLVAGFACQVASLVVAGFGV